MNLLLELECQDFKSQLKATQPVAQTHHHIFSPQTESTFSSAYTKLSYPGTDWPPRLISPVFLFT